MPAGLESEQTALVDFLVLAKGRRFVGFGTLLGFDLPDFCLGEFALHPASAAVPMQPAAGLLAHQVLFLYLTGLAPPASRFSFSTSGD